MSNEAKDEACSAANGKVGNWPECHVATVTLESIGKRTNMTVYQTGSKEKAKEIGAYQSWVMMFNKLNQRVQKTN